jgi:WXG100 family type VII secretion target
MAGRILATPEEMRSAAGSLDAKAQELIQMLQQIKSQIDSLSPMWQGQAATKFTELMTQWSSDVQGIENVLSTVSRNLQQAAQSYEDVDMSISRGFQVS